MDVQVPAIEQPADGVETVRGTLVPGGVECPLLRTDDGRVYALQGVRPADLPDGELLTVRGRPLMFSTCQQGQGFLVEQIER
ncbi:DUF5818 domain-containing protein [Salinarimonas sp.]|uniref:DUF5818 domain-containing protein n=1 Tax=Salinarimonas sp. TaxID=2766526 RepID=UPI0032D90DB3